MERTVEQDTVVELVRAGESVAVQAGAGTGKTTTLVEVAKDTDRIGYYLAFNREIVRDAGARMPDTVIASTAHGLAMKSVGHHYRHRIGSDRQLGWELARRLDVGPLSVKVAGVKFKRLDAGFLASLVLRTIRQWCMSAEERPSSRHTPYVEGIDLPDALGRRGMDNNMLVREHVEPYLERAWADLSNPAGTLPYTHDHYLKLWQLSHPRIPAEFILFDEAQDASPVMLAAIEEQDAQIVWVGDSQQQIYEWRGAVDALDRIDAEHRSYLTQSFRFGPAIADVANVVLSRLHADLRLVGAASHESRVEEVAKPDAILTRTNAEAVSRVLKLAVQGETPYLVGGGNEVAYFCRGAKALMEGGKTYHPDLACFDSWGEVEAYVQDDPNGDELALMVKLVEEFGVEVILDALDRMPRSEQRATVVVSTAHKAKGREWNSVKLASDFPFEDVTQPEWRLMYVALTRARQQLDVTQCLGLRQAVTLAKLKSKPIGPVTLCLAHMQPEPCETCAAYIAAGL